MSWHHNEDKLMESCQKIFDISHEILCACYNICNMVCKKREDCPVQGGDYGGIYICMASTLSDYLSQKANDAKAIKDSIAAELVVFYEELANGKS